jgi:hypothetical protein
MNLLSISFRTTEMTREELWAVTVELSSADPASDCDRHREVLAGCWSNRATGFRLINIPRDTAEWLRDELLYWGDPGDDWNPEVRHRCRPFQRMARELQEKLTA